MYLEDIMVFIHDLLQIVLNYQWYFQNNNDNNNNNNGFVLSFFT